MITKIDITETIHTMGETSEEDAEKFCDYLREQLADEYPDAKIIVTLDSRISSTQINVESSVDDDGFPTETDPDGGVEGFINRTWDSMVWCG